MLVFVGDSFTVVTWVMVTGSDSPVLQAVSASAVAQRVVLAHSSSVAFLWCVLRIWWNVDASFTLMKSAASLAYCTDRAPFV